ncbi:MAG: hypothetical protein KGL35_09655 [Bradyrhizobium sp.]|nr:hypothetical protein [Bradyrhizobium sp.]
MPWTDAQLAAAFNALSPVPSTLDAAAKLLNAQTATVTVDVPLDAVEGYLLVNGISVAAADWLAANAATNVPVANAIRSLQALIASPRLQSVAMTDAATNMAVTNMTGAMVSVGVMTAAQQAALLAMAKASVPAWQPALQIADLQRIQRAGAISATIEPYPGYVAP